MINSTVFVTFNGNKRVVFVLWILQISFLPFYYFILHASPYQRKLKMFVFDLCN